MSENLLRPGEVAKALKVSVRTVANYADQGILVATVTKGGHRRFTAEEVRRFLKSRKADPVITFPQLEF